VSEPTIASVLDKSIDKLSGGAAEIGRAAKQVAPHAWEVAVRQQVIEGTVHLTEALIAISAVVALAIYVLRNAKTWHAAVIKETTTSYRPEGDSFGFWMPFFFCAFLALMIFGVAIGSASNAVMQIANPEYYAAKALLEAVK
jgi:hypothetical protein